jgi:hypothetical protein
MAARHCLKDEMDRQQLQARRRWLALLALGGFNLLCVGLAGFIGARFFAWPLSFGIPLFTQVLCFMALCFALARRTLLYPDHPSFAGTPSAAVIARMERTRVRLLAVDLAGAGIAIGLGLVFLIWASANPAREQPLLWAIACVTLALTFALLAHSTTLYSRRSEQEYVRHAGTPASARVLKVTNMRVRQRAPSYDAARLYVLDLEVMPLTGAAYQVSIQQLIRTHPAQMPAVGATIPVKYLPEQPQVVVTLLNPEDRAPEG